MSAVQTVKQRHGARECRAMRMRSKPRAGGTLPFTRPGLHSDRQTALARLLRSRRTDYDHASAASFANHHPPHRPHPCTCETDSAAHRVLDFVNASELSSRQHYCEDAPSNGGRLQTRHQLCARACRPALAIRRERLTRPGLCMRSLSLGSEVRSQNSCALDVCRSVSMQVSGHRRTGT